LPKPAAGDTPNAATGQPCQFPHIEVGSAAACVVFSIPTGAGLPSTALRYAFGMGSSDGTAWSVPYKLATKTYKQMPRLARDTTSTVHVFETQQSAGGMWDLYHYTTTDGANYSSQSTPSTNWQYHAWSADITTDSANNVHVVWQSDDDYGNGKPGIVYRKRVGGSWGARKSISESYYKFGNQDNWSDAMNISDGKGSESVGLAMDSAGNLHVVYDGVYYTSSADGGSWSTPVSIHDGGEMASIAVDANNGLHAVWSLDGTIYYNKTQ
jgi:hypothetical protein